MNNYLNNTKNTKIAMTTPVHMEKKRGENSMAFVLPKKFTNENTPQPNDASLRVYEDGGGYFAAIKYSGYSNTSKEKEYAGFEIIEVLEENRMPLSTYTLVHQEAKLSAEEKDVILQYLSINNRFF